MTTWRIVKWIWLRGTESGCILGAVYGTLIVPLLGTVFGLLLGVILGTVTGIVTGMALAVMTRLSSTSSRSTLSFRCSAVGVAIISTAVTIDALLGWGIAPHSFIHIIVIASVAAGFFAWRLPDVLTPTEVSTRPANAVLFYIEK